MDLTIKRAGILGGIAGSVISATLTAVALTALHHHDTASASSGSSPVRVTACTPGGALDMTVAVANTEATARQYTLQLDWYLSDGTSYLSKTYTTDPIEPGRTLTVQAGNSHDQVDYKPGIRCYAKVLGSS